MSRPNPHIHLDVAAFVTVGAMTILFGAIWRPISWWLSSRDSKAAQAIGQAMEIIY